MKKNIKKVMIARGFLHRYKKVHYRKLISYSNLNEAIKSYKTSHLCVNVIIKQMKKNRENRFALTKPHQVSVPSFFTYLIAFL